jgi:2-oxoglutarate ferredoxin oxidoreductase subunit beta
VTGDGDGLSIGGNHLLHTLRRNLDLQVLLFNNKVYGLTKGQYSPTSDTGMITKSTPTGSIDHPVDPIAFALGCGATFLSRTIDVDANHLRETLRRAHEHKGTSFVEILQNCPVFNDEVWSEVEDRKQRMDTTLALRHGEPLVFGAPGRKRGIVLDQGVPSIVALEDDEDPVDKGVVVHDEKSATTAYPFALASLRRPDFPLPIGIFRAVEKPCYEAMVQQQVDNAVSQRGPGDLRALLHSGDTWQVEA